MKKKVTILLILIIILAFVHTFIGTTFYSINDLIKEQYARDVFAFIRIPRTILAILTGSALAISGSYIQVITKNDIASPSILGVNDGAILGVVVALTFFPSASLLMTNIIAIIFSFLTILIIFLIASFIKDGFSKVKLAIIGLIISSYVGTLASIAALSLGGLQSVDHYFLGGLMNSTWIDVFQVFIALVICIVPLIIYNKYVIYFQIDDDRLTTLGVNTTRIKIIILVLCIILAATTTAVVGKLTFLGLIAPNIAKLIVRYNKQYLVLISALIGVLLVLVADSIAQLINYPYEISLTVILTIIGIPYFFYLVSKKGEV